MDYTIRPATAADVADLVEIVVVATKAQGRFPADADEQAYREGFSEWTHEQVQGLLPDNTTSVIVVDGQTIGRLRVERRRDALELCGLQLLPAFQNRGIGSSIIRTLAAEAHNANTPFVLRVEKDNPHAQRLYSRLGFVVAGEDEREYHLRYVHP